MWLSISLLSFLCVILFILYKPERNYPSIGVYYRKIRIELSAVRYRRDVFSEVATGELVEIKPDPSKVYNGNAIGAFTQSGKLLGYIPRGQRRLINLFRDHPGSLALVYKKFQKGAHLRILIDVFLPEPQTRMLPARTSTTVSSKENSIKTM
jgi:hypothetical protein